MRKDDGRRRVAAAPELADAAKIGVLAGSLVAGVLGFLVLRFASRFDADAEDEAAAGRIFAVDRD